MRHAEDVRGRALRLHDLELRDVTLRVAGEASDCAVLEAVRRERMAEASREFAAGEG